MVIGILQPGYLPWLGFFEQLARSDVFVIYDDVQYDKHGWRNRNRIKTPQGAQWLTVPVQVSLKQAPLIHEVRIDNKADWRKKHLLSIRHAYARAPYFGRVFPVLEEALNREWELLIDLDLHMIVKMAEMLGIAGPKIVRSSGVNVTGGTQERLLALCKHFGADTFYEGASGRDYIDERLFSEQGVRVVFQEYSHPSYRQLHGEFISHLSAIDLLFNHGEESLSILMNKTDTEVTHS